MSRQKKSHSKTKSSGHNGHNGQRKTEKTVTAKRKTKVAAKKQKTGGPNLPNLPDPERSESDQLEEGEAIALQFAEWRSKEPPNSAKIAVQKAIYARKLREIGLPNGNAILNSAVEAFQNEQETTHQVGTSQEVESAEKELRQTPEILAEANRILQAPSILEEMLSATTAMGHVSEEPMRMLVFLSAVAGLTARSHKDAIHLILKGESSGGKNAVLNRVLALFPKTTALILTSATEAAFAYAESVPVLVFQEVHGQKGADMIVRQIQSEGLVTRRTAYRNLEAVYKTSVITTTTLDSIHHENETRAFSMHVSKDPELTHQIMLADERTDTGELPPKLDDTLLLAWHEAMSLLVVGEVVLPLQIARELTELFPIELTRSRRDRPRAANLVKACALLHQNQRGRDSQGRVEAIGADYEMVLPILGAIEDAQEPLRTVQGEEILKLLTKLSAAKAPDGMVWQTALCRAASDAGGPSEKTVRRWLKRFLERGLVRRSGGGGRVYYQLTSYKAAV